MTPPNANTPPPEAPPPEAPPPGGQSLAAPSPDPQPQGAAKRKNTIGLIALIVAVVGFIFACIPGALIVGWVLLPVAFILGIVGVAQSNRKKAGSVTAIILSVVGTIVAVVVFVAVVAQAVDEAGASSTFSAHDLTSSSASDSGDAGGSEGSAANDGPQGTRDDPYPIGQQVSNDDWTITLGDPYDATDAVHDENDFNDPPQDGMDYWIVPVQATYVGQDTGMPGMAITVEFVSADGHTYDDRCGVIPDDLFDVGELYPDAAASGNECMEVPSGADGLWKLSAGIFSDPVFFAAQ